MIWMLLLAMAPTPAEPGRLLVSGAWRITVTAGMHRAGSRTVRVARETTLDVRPSTRVEIRDEKHDALPPFNRDAPGWMRGVRLRALVTFETSAAGLLDPETLRVKAGPGEAAAFHRDRDYAIDPVWATVGRLPDGSIAERGPVWLDYACGLHRLDCVVVDRAGAVRLIEGEPHAATPQPPSPRAGETVIANIWVPGRLAALSDECLYPILSTGATAQRSAGAPPASRLLPKTWKKLTAGEPLHVLAWGDSVTAGGQASDEEHRYQNQFVTLLSRRFPKASNRLTTAGWGGRTSDNFLQEPPESPYNFERAVLAPRPDLVIMEFVNDAWMSPEVVEQKYLKIKERLDSIGAEWVILTPHFVRPDWMGATTVRVTEDPRPYTAGVRAFGKKHGVAVADAAARWGNLVREGIPYVTLLANSINHPDDRGMEIFAQALMDLFR